MDYTRIPLADCPTGTEGEVMLFALDRVHRKFAWKTGGLTVDQLQQRHPPSKMTLAWLIIHLTRVEADWTAKAEGRSHEESLGGMDWDAHGRQPDRLYGLWYDTIARTRQSWATMINDGGLDTVVDWGDGYRVNRRRALTDILEENLLHTGHASIVREAVDGLIGNDPP
ncbi:mycothiol transferase [Microlunatus parietis]|uniref:DinB superfamily protein n=2 Tax=Microlunatus parietis TaxID=682979 RepID=A0A7Y9LC72_9ACTN|nr:hypothetical protein [Microlunatus parietis]